MLAMTAEMHQVASVSRKPKRTRITARKSAAIAITIREVVRTKGESRWTTYLVQGWQENGKWQRKQFKDRGEAESFAAMKRVQLENEGAAQRMILSRLTQAQHDEAVVSIERLGTDYSLSEAVTFFLKHHRPPEFTIRADGALGLYLHAKEADGVRERTRKAIKSVLGQFIEATDNPWVHEITPQSVDAFLRGLRAKDGTEKATRKTWNNYRNDLNGFFTWCATADKSTNRPFTFENPVAGVKKFKARLVREEQGATPTTTSPDRVLGMFSALMRWRGGALVRHFAYLYFAGLRPGEIQRFAPREAELVNLKTGIIIIPANVSKTRHERQIRISPNLAAWLKATAGMPVMPTNFDRLAKLARKHFALTHDEARHSFISYHVAAHRSIGDAAPQAGNSESIVKRHYLNTHTREEGEAFWRIIPDMERRRALLAPEPRTPSPSHLIAV
jgi:integrase